VGIGVAMVCLVVAHAEPASTRTKRIASRRTAAA
jgi:hypothetical protein